MRRLRRIEAERIARRVLRGIRTGAIARIRRGLVDLRPAIVTFLFLTLVIGVVGVAPLAPRPAMREPAGFAIAPAGDEVARLAPISVTFPKAPSERDPDKLISLEPAPRGTYAWLSARTLLFQPDYPGLARGALYSLRVPARPEAGLPEQVTRRFTVTGRLAVQQVIPADGDTEVPLSAQIIVQLSRSVAPLTTLAAQPSGAVLSFDPPLAGKGEWLNTSIYRFIPSDLAPSTAYRLTVAKGLTAAADGVLQDDFRSAFTTIAPAVAAITPEDRADWAGPWQQVVVRFNQPMDRSAASGITVRDDSGNAVPGSFAWSDQDTVATFSPAVRFAPAARYSVAVEPGLRAAAHGTTAVARTVSFTTIGLPAVASTEPPDGATAAGRFGISIRFATPMDPDSLEGKLSVSGFDAAHLEGRVFADERMLNASLALRPRTSYTVALAAGATDRYGQAMAGHRFTFTTGAVPSSVSLALAGSAQAATYSASTEPVLFFYATNVSSAAFTLWPLTNDEGARLLHNAGSVREFTPSQPALRTWTETVRGAQDEQLLGSTSLSGGGPLPKGFYFLRTGGQLGSYFAFAVVDTVIVTKLSHDELLAWAIDHQSGEPVAGVAVHAIGGATPDRVTTDASGLASFAVPRALPGQGVDRSYFLSLDGAGRSGALSTRWQQGTSPFQFGLPTEYWAREWVGHVYTDRPIYRPGETVQYKIVVRADDDARYSLPPAQPPLQFVISNARGQQLRREDVRPNEFGSFAGWFELPRDAPTGDYSMSLQQKREGGFGTAIAGNRVVVAEFRKPEFGVEVRASSPSYANGDAIDVSTTATFYFGGALEGAGVAWSVLSEPFVPSAKGYQGYSFGDRDQAKPAAPRDPVRAKGAATTATGGVASYAVPAALSGDEGAQRFVLSATVADASGQAVAGSTSVTVHPAALYAGIRPARYVASERADTTLQLVTVDTAGGVLPGHNVAVKVYDRQWITTKEQLPGGGRRYRSEPRDTLVQTLQATTGANGEGTVTFRPTKPGTLRVVAEVTDDRGRTARSATYVWVGGGGFASWQVTNDDTIKLVADKERYEVGDTAEILVPAPFSGATGLVTVERGKVITRATHSFPTNSERLRIPITDGSVPNVFVSVVLYRPPTGADPIPRFKVGYVQLPVSTATRELLVSIRPDREQAKPGEKVHYDIAVTDRSGKGVRAEVSVAVVDRAVLALQEDRGPDGLRAFWVERGLGVNTASSMAVSVERWNDVIGEPPRQGKGGSGAQVGRIREDFRNTAYWSAQLVTRDDGTAGVDVTMPDDLTTWRMQVRAVSGDTMVGEGLNELVSTKPLLVRPALPRFLRVGDAAELRVLVRNATRAASDVQVALRAEGVSVAGALTRSATVQPGTSAILGWPAVAESEGTVRLTFTATGTGELSDSVALTLPALLDVTPETTATGGVVAGEGALEAVYLPPFADTKKGSLRVSVQSALAGSMADELAALAPVDREGAERVSSRLIATLGVRRAERSVAPAASARDGVVASDLAGLAGRQRPDGGWAWCDDPLCGTDPNVTGWALLALGEARRDGQGVDAGVLTRATAYVSAYVNRVTDVASPADASQKAFLLAALAAAAGRDASAAPVRALFEQSRSRLAPWGLAYLALGLTDGGAAPDDPQLRTILGDLAATTIASANGNHWEDPAVRGSFMTSTATTALVTLALTRAQPQHALLPQSVRWLVVARGAQRWQTSIDRAIGVLALTSHAVQTGELGGDFRYAVELDDAEVLAGVVKPTGTRTAATKTLPLTTLTPGRSSILAFSRDAGRPGRLYYTLDLRYVTPAKEIEALNRGFAIAREYTSLEDPARPITAARLGDTVRVKVTVISPADHNYVVVEDLLPAGLEPVDARLRTVDPALRAKLEADRAGAAQRQAGGYQAPWFRWYYSPWQQVDLRDDRAVLVTDRLPRGIHEYVYYARATTVGDFFVAPAHAAETYFPEVFGRSDSGRFTVGP